MTPLILYLITLAIFLVLDFFGLTYLIKPTFERDIGPLLASPFRILPVFLFYAFYIGVLLWFVSWPGLTQEKSLWWVLGNAMLLGAFGYGTYEFTNYATLKDWTSDMVFLDLTWGIALTGITATAGVAIARSFG